MHFRRRAALLLLILLIFLSNSALAVTPSDWERSRPEVLAAGHLFSQSAILIDADTGETLFEKDAHARMYPASTTKVMTLLLALESDIALDDMVTIPREAQQIPEGSSVVPVIPGEEMSWRDLLHGFMMKSGNDGANAIAVLVSGNLDSFVELMNQRAQALGCTGTHFTNAHGYHDDEHFSTAADLAVIAREAMKNEAFRQIVATAKYTMAATTKRGEMEISTRNELVNPDSHYYYPDCVGIKTGYHSKAGQCLVGAASRDGKLLISVVLNSDGKKETQKWYDTARLFEYGYTCYTPYTLGQLAEYATANLTSVMIDGAAADDPEGGRLQLRLSDLDNADASMLVRNLDDAPKQAMEELWRNGTISLREGLAAPISAGEVVGNFTCTMPSGPQVRVPLAAMRSIEAAPIIEPTPIPEMQGPSAPQPPAPRDLSWVPWTVIGVFVGFLGLFMAVRLIQRARRRARRKRLMAAKAKARVRRRLGLDPKPKKADPVS